MLNSINLVGRLTKDPETRKIPAAGNEISVTEFDLANNGLKQKDGSEDTLFIRVQCFGTQADAAAKYLKKGSLVSVSGRLHAFTYKKKNSGEEAKGFEVIANNVDFIDTGAKPAEPAKAAPAAKAEEPVLPF